MTLQALIAEYGYWALAAGCLLEGETMLLLAGFAARRGQLDPGWVFTIAALAGFTGDQFFFWLGRHHGTAVLARWPRAQRRVERMHELMRRFRDAVIVFVRFAYGLRVVGPIIIGMSSVPAPRFAVLNAIGALLWAAIVGGVGWVLGEAAEALIGNIEHVEGWLLLTLAAAALIAWLVNRLRGL